MSAHARTTDPATSHYAAETLDVRPIDRMILAALHLRGDDGATSSELADLTGLDRVTVSPRLRPLTRLGKILDTGQTRRYRTQKPGIVWRVACQ